MIYEWDVGRSGKRVTLPTKQDESSETYSFVDDVPTNKIRKFQVSSLCFSSQLLHNYFQQFKSLLRKGGSLWRNMRNVFGNARPPWMMKQPIISHGIIYKKSVNLKIIFSDFIRKSSLPLSILIPDINSVRPEGIHARDDYTCCALPTSSSLIWLHTALEGVSPLLIPFGRSLLQSRTQKLWLESVDFVRVLCCVLIISLFVGAMRRGRLSWNEFSGFEMMSEITEPWWREKDVVAARPDAGEETKEGAQERQIVPAGAERVIQDFPSSSLADLVLLPRSILIAADEPESSYRTYFDVKIALSHPTERELPLPSLSIGEESQFSNDPSCFARIGISKQLCVHVLYM